MAPRSRTTSRLGGNGTRAPAIQRNLLLSLLPDSELDALLEYAEVIKPQLRETFAELHDPIESVLFPLTGMASLVTVLNDGTSLEAMTVGCEGFVGLALFHGLKTHTVKAMCQIEGEFYSIPAKSFKEVLSKSPALQSLLHRYSQYASEVLTQSAACNAMHLIEQRCARWLLSTRDAIGKTKFNLTQEFLSQMLAVRRPGVTVAMGGLERQALISHRYGIVDIIDVDGLKRVSCECYQTIHGRQRELLAS
jgi:CRP-like cAMP-binding protein